MISAAALSGRYVCFVQMSPVAGRAAQRYWLQSFGSMCSRQRARVGYRVAIRLHLPRSCCPVYAPVGRGRVARVFLFRAAIL